MDKIQLHLKRPTQQESFTPSVAMQQIIGQAQNTVHPDFAKIEQEQNQASSPQSTPIDSKVPDASSVKPNMEVIAPSSTILGVSKPIFFAGVGVIACVAIGGGIWYYIKNKKQ